MVARKPSEAGMSLIEVVIAAVLLAILAAGVGGLAVFMLRAQRNLEFRAEALAIAESELDRIHAQDQDLARLPGEQTEQVEGFSKKVTRVFEFAKKYEFVTVEVSWNRGGEKGSVSLSGGHYPWTGPDAGHGGGDSGDD